MGNYAAINLNEQHLRASLGSIQIAFDESDWIATQVFLDGITLNKKQAVAQKTKRYLLLFSALIFSAGFFSLVVFKDKIFPGSSGNDLASVPAVSTQEATSKANKIFNDVGPLDMEPRKPAEAKKEVAASVGQDSTVAVIKAGKKISSEAQSILKVKEDVNVISSTKIKEDVKVNSAASKLVSSKKKKQSKEKEKKSKKKSSGSNQGFKPKHNPEDDEVIIGN
ncbi:MAG: hypothetical protein ACK452_16325 [Bacteroidota bacterium]|jgi:hypothetical protein